MNPSLARYRNDKIAGSKLAVLPHSGHMTFVDQPRLYIQTLDAFLR
jgi:pimeloyl-ACP methyl ester carboxylesterase